MILTSLPVAPFSKKILLSEYTMEPIKVSKNHFLNQVITIQKATEMTKLKMLTNVLTDKVELLVNKKLIAELERNGAQIGYALRKWHFEKMLNFVYSQFLVNVPAQSALKRFYALHDISEDDFPLDSAYKKWQRFWEAKKNAKKPDFFGTDFPDYGYDQCKNWQDKRTCSVPISDQALDLIIRDVCNTHVRRFYNQRVDDFRRKLFAQFTVYVYMRLGNRPWQYVAKKFDMPRRTVFYSRKAFDELLKQDPDLSMAIDTHPMAI